MISFSLTGLFLFFSVTFFELYLIGSLVPTKSYVSGLSPGKNEFV